LSSEHLYTDFNFNFEYQPVEAGTRTLVTIRAIGELPEKPQGYVITLPSGTPGEWQCIGIEA